jgi:hypothetical protein
MPDGAGKRKLVKGRISYYIDRQILVSVFYDKVYKIKLEKRIYLKGACCGTVREANKSGRKHRSCLCNFG